MDHGEDKRRRDRFRVSDKALTTGTVCTSSARTPAMLRKAANSCRVRAVRMYADPLAGEIRGRVDALVGKTVDHRGQALVEDGDRDQRRAPADRGDGRGAGGGPDRVAARGHGGRGGVGSRGLHDLDVEPEPLEVSPLPGEVDAEAAFHWGPGGNST